MRSAAEADVPVPCRAEPAWPSAVIAGAYQTGVLGVRSLRRRGVRAVCFDCNPAYPGFRSVYGPAKLAPDPDRHPEAWVDFMVELARSLGERPVLIPSSDQFVTAIATHRAALAAHYRLSPGVALQGELAEKAAQYALAAAHGMPLPRTQPAGSIADVERFAAEARYPCLMKPMHFREWRRLPGGHPLLGAKIAIAASPSALLVHYAGVAEVTPQVMLQEIIEGPDTAKRVYLACYDAGANRIAHAMFRELRCEPVGFGPASVSEPVVDAETDAVCDRFLRSIGYSGICEIEMKWDSNDGRVKLIEANPRLSGGGDAAPYDGVDLCWLHYLEMIGQQFPPVVPSGRRFRHVVLRSDAVAAPAYLAAGLLTWRELLRSYRPPLAFYDFDLRDWRYSAETLALFARSILRGAAGALFSKRPTT
jgi:predicted ATP-grasp superfamily ATP-dependent carboligase